MKNILMTLLTAFGVILFYAAVDCAQTPLTEDALYKQIIEKISKTNRLYIERQTNFEGVRQQQTQSVQPDNKLTCASFAEWYMVFQDKVANSEELVNLSKQGKFKSRQSQVNKEIDNSVVGLSQNQKSFDRLAAEFGCQLSAVKSDGTSNPNSRYELFKSYDYFGSTAKTEEKPVTKSEVETAKQKIAVDRFVAETAVDDAKKLVEQGYYEQALKNLNEIIKNYPDNSVAYTERAIVYHNLGYWDLLIADANKAIGLDPQDALAYRERSAGNTLRGKMDEGKADREKALELVNKAIAQNPKDSVSYWIRGQIYEGVGNHSEAAADFTKAIDINPQFTSAYSNRGYAYFYQSDNYYEALDDFNRAVALSPKSVSAFIARAQVYHFLGENDKAAADINQVLKLDPANSNAKLMVTMYQTPELDFDLIKRYLYLSSVYNKAADKFDSDSAKYAEIRKTQTDKALVCQSLAALYASFQNQTDASMKLLFADQHPEILEFANSSVLNKQIAEAAQKNRAFFKAENQERGCKLTMN